MELTTKELLTNYGIGTENILVNLGTENGWSEKTNDLYHELIKRRDYGSYKTEGLSTYKTISFTVTEDGNIYKIVYYLDSGD